MQKNLLRTFIIIAVVVGATIALAVIINARMVSAPVKAAEINEVFPTLTVKDMKGKNVDILATHAGKTLLVNYWATWCPPCISEIPSLLKLKQEKQSATFDIVFVSLDFPKSPEDLKSQMARINLEKFDTLYMTDARQWSDLKGRGLPITVLVGPEGNIMSRFVGGMDWSGPEAADFLSPVFPLK